MSLPGVILSPTNIILSDQLEKNLSCVSQSGLMNKPGWKNSLASGHAGGRNIWPRNLINQPALGDCICNRAGGFHLQPRWEIPSATALGDFICNRAGGFHLQPRWGISSATTLGDFICSRAGGFHLQPRWGISSATALGDFISALRITREAG